MTPYAKSSISSKRGSLRWSIHIVVSIKTIRTRNYGSDGNCWRCLLAVALDAPSCGVIFCTSRVKNRYEFGVRSG